MKRRPAAGSAFRVPVPSMLGVFAAGSLLVVLLVPALAGLVTGAESAASLPVLVLTWAAMVAASGAYLFPMSAVLGLSRHWFRFGMGCLAALELILFVMIPLSFEEGEPSGTDYLIVGITSAVLALLVFGQIAKAARRYLPPRAWPSRAKVTMAALAAVAGLLGGLSISAALGNPAGSTLDEVGILTIAAAALSGYSLAEALDRSTRAPLVAVEGRVLIATTIRIGVALLVILHLVWFLYLTRVF